MARKKATAPVGLHPTRVYGVEKIAKALGLTPYMTIQLLQEFGVETRRGMTPEQIDDLRSVVDLFLRERKQDQQQRQRDRTPPAHPDRKLKLIPAVGEKRKGPGQGRVTKVATATLAEERRQRKAQEKKRQCLWCRRRFLSFGPGNRMCESCRRRAAA